MPKNAINAIKNAINAISDLTANIIIYIYDH
jgi:hypothetical protein